MKRLYMLLCGSVLLTGCYGPYQEARYEEIHTNETAFLVPLEGDTDKQEKSKALEILEKSKVLAKRIEIPTRKRTLGRGWTNFEWVPTMKVVRVDRSPVSRDWTGDSKTGTSAQDQALYVESKDSINFGFSGTLTAHIEEEDTAKFLYYFAGKQLSEIVDQNVRGIALQQLSAKAGHNDLAACIAQKHTFMKEAEAVLKTECKKKGITVDFFGGIKGVLITDKSIQVAVDSKYIKEVDAQKADKELQVQAIRNEIQVAAAETERLVAQELYAAKDALQLKTMLDVLKLDAEAMKAASSKWKGSMPRGIIPAGSGLLFGLEQQGVDVKEQLKLLSIPATSVKAEKPQSPPLAEKEEGK